jgi:hypothetical protein
MSDFEKTINKKDDIELIGILNSSNNYQPIFIGLAEKELNKRGVSAKSYVEYIPSITTEELENIFIHSEDFNPEFVDFVEKELVENREISIEKLIKKRKVLEIYTEELSIPNRTRIHRSISAKALIIRAIEAIISVFTTVTILVVIFVIYDDFSLLFLIIFAVVSISIFVLISSLFFQDYTLVLDKFGIAYSKGFRCLYYRWEEINDEKIIWKLKPKVSSHHLTYNYPNGKADIDLRFLNTNKRELAKLIRIYRERNNQLKQN